MIRLILALVLLAGAAPAQTIRVATFNASLSRSGPGILYKDLARDPLPEQIDAVAAIITDVAPDILLLNEFDYDGGNAALDRFRAILSARGLDYPYFFAQPVNTGIPTGLDLDGDGSNTGPGDSYGFGRYPGQYGMAILSRFPIDADSSRTFSQMLWADLPGALLPVDAGGNPFPSKESLSAMRLSSKGHWDVEVRTPQGSLRLLASHPTPPVFDGPEDLNGRRNHDEIRFWTEYLNGAAFRDDQGREAGLETAPFVILGDLNSDPVDGDGLHDGIRGLLTHTRVYDPEPRSVGAIRAAAAQGGANARHKANPALDTADWNDGNPGNLRVDFLLPSTNLTVAASGVYWPASDEVGESITLRKVEAASDHRLVWIDIVFPLPVE